MDKRRETVYEAQRYMAKKLYNIRFPGQASGFVVIWPVIRNFRVYQGSQIALGSPLDLKSTWIDPTKAPLV